MPKEIRVNGRSLTIHGRHGDPYFDHFDLGHKTNDFLLYAADRYVKADDTVLDIGANIGITTCVLSLAAHQGRVFSFEPDPDTFALLENTIAVNGLTNATPHQIALGATSGSLAFLTDATTASASHLAPADTSLAVGNIQVAVYEMDRFVEREELTRIDFIKIDVEGFELDVLQGGAATIARLRPKVFLEFNSFTLIAYGNRNPRALLEYLIDKFPFVYRFETGRLLAIRSEAEQLSFIHDNLVHRGCVDDLICSFHELT
jgi:FkbM family methyltransferase